MSRDGRLRVHALVDGLACGGAEMLLAEFASAAADAGIDLSVGYLQDVQGSPAADRLRRVGVEPELVPVSSLLNPVDHRRVRRHLARIAPDIVHTHLGSADLLGGIAARSLGLPAFSTLHATNWRSSSLAGATRQRLSALARRWCATRVVTVSESARQSYIATGWDRPERVVTVLNGVRGEARPGAGAQVRRELGIGAGETVVAMVSALRPEKNHAQAVAAMQRLARGRPGLRLLIAGDGPLRAEVEGLAAESGATVIMAGFRDDVMAVLDASDLLLHPSVHEAFPTTLLEAMAASVPIVATAVGGIPEIVQDGITGRLVAPSATADRIGEAVAAALADDTAGRRMAAAGRERFDAEFTLDRWVRRTRTLYDEALATHSIERTARALQA